MKEIRIDYLIRQVNTYLIQYGKEHMGKLDMTPAQSMVLSYMLVRGKKEYCQTELCEEVGLSKATMCVVIKALCKRSYLRMEREPSDIRKKKILLTDRAFEAREEIEGCLKERTNCMFRGIPASDRETLERALDQMVENLRRGGEK